MQKINKLNYPIDHQKQDTVVSYSSDFNIKPGDDANPTPPLNITDKGIASAIEQIAGHSTLRERQFIPVVQKFRWFI